MKEDPALFKYELAFVIIIKNAAPYMREWIEYHRLAGVDHFCFYDNESTDNLEGVLKPYIDSGLVDYQKFPGKTPQCAAYEDAVQRYRFDCRYLGFIDDDEFVRPIDHKQTIKDVLHELLDARDDAAGLTINSYTFGSSGFETADYDTDVMIRFQRRGEEAGTHPKVIANPRLIEFVENCHYLNFFDGIFSINPRGEYNAYIQNLEGKVFCAPPATNKIVCNHYSLKSREEYLKKLERGDAFFAENARTAEAFDIVNENCNKVFDEGIVKYREARLSEARPASESSTVIRNRRFNVMLQKLFPGMSANTPSSVFTNRLHEFLTCLSIARSLRNNLLDDRSADYFEELALHCMLRSFSWSNINTWQAQLLLEELPSILPLKYPSIAALKTLCLQFIPEMLKFYRSKGMWRRYHQYDYLARMLKG